MKKKASYHSFTLLEVLAALTLFALLSLPLFLESGRAFEENLRLHQKRRGLLLGYQKILELLYGLEVEQSGTIGEKEIYQWEWRGANRSLKEELQLVWRTLEIGTPSGEKLQLHAFEWPK